VTHWETNAKTGERVALGSEPLKTASKALPLLTVWYDTREQNPIEPPEGVTLVKVSLPTGDYSTSALQMIGIIERKSVADLASSITHGRERFDDEIRRMRDYRWRAIVIEGEIGEVLRYHNVHVHSVLGTVASFFARSDVPCLFAGTRPAAARLICGILRRWEERLLAERESGDAA
jgi:ERCC4-type nuclease